MRSAAVILAGQDPARSGKATTDFADQIMRRKRKRMTRKSGDWFSGDVMLGPPDTGNTLRNGQCGRDRRPVGRRGQGQDRRLVVGARRHRRALPGRPQCRPYAFVNARLQAVAAALRRRAPQAGASSATAWWSIPGPCSTRSQSSSGRACRSARKSAGRRERHADPAAAPRARCSSAKPQRGNSDRHHPPRHRSGL